MTKKQQYRTLKLTMELEKYDIIIRAIKEIQKENTNISEARALELICIEFINAPNGTTGINR